MEHTFEFFAGCLGGCAGVVVGHPFDTVKVRMQMDHPVKPLYRNTFHCFQSIVKQESFLGLYKGVSAPLCSLALINAVVFGVQNNVLKRMENPDALSSHFLAGSFAGLSQTWICAPMELVKTKLQDAEKGLSRDSKSVYSGAADCLKKIYHAEGLRGVGRGFNITVIREIPAFGIYFVSYEYMTRKFTPEGAKHCPMIGLLMAGGLAGCCSWFSNYPVDVIKTRIQADGVYKDGKFHYKYAGYKDCFKKSLAEEGWSFLYRGLTPTLLRAFPTNAATFTVVTLALRYLQPQFL